MRRFALLTACSLACAGLQAQAPSIDRTVEYGRLVQTQLQAHRVHVTAAKANAPLNMLVKTEETGNVISAQVKQSSGVAAMDAMADTAIQRASP